MLLCKNRNDQKYYFMFCKKRSPFMCSNTSDVTSHQTSLEASLHLPDNQFFILTVILHYGDLRRVSDSVSISEYYIFNVLNS